MYLRKLGHLRAGPEDKDQADKVRQDKQGQGKADLVVKVGQTRCNGADLGQE